MANLERHFEQSQFSDGGDFSSSELVFNPDRLPHVLTPNMLYYANRSYRAHDRQQDWDIHRFDGRHILTAACADARLEIPLDVMTERIYTIATGGPKAPFEHLLRSRNSNSIVILAHHDGETVRIGEMPTGCGGLGTKARIKSNGKNEDPVHDFINEDVDHEDVIIQACMSAMNVAELTDKPVLAATQDHLTGEIHPLISFERGNISFNEDLSLRDIIDPARYDPKRIYQNGLPCADRSKLPDIFSEYLEANAKEMDDLLRRYPDFRQMQKVQNPYTVILTTDIRPTRLKYDALFDDPGSFFRLTIPRIKNSQGEDIGVGFSPEEIARVFRQVKYSIDYFSNVINIILETPNYGESEKIGHSLAQQKWMEDWKHKEGANILVLETRGGKIYTPQQLTYAA